MINVVFVAPFLGATMVHALSCFANLRDVKLGVVSHQPEDQLPPSIRSKIAGHYQIDDALDAQNLAKAASAFTKEWGRVDRLEGYLEPLQVPLGEARDALGIDGLGAQQARNFRDKNRMKQVLREAGIPVARQALIGGPADALAFARQAGFPLVLKPLDGLGAKNTSRVNTDPELLAALNHLYPRPDRPIQAEQFVEGDEHTFETAVVAGSPVWWSSQYYLPGPLKVLENPWMQCCLLLPREDQPHAHAFADINRRALAALGMQNGLAHLEWFLQPNGQAVVSEVAARPPGANICMLNSHAHQVDFWQMWAELMAHRRWRMPERKYAAGCAFVRAQGRGRTIAAISNLDDVQKKIAGLVVDKKLPRPGQLRSDHYEGDGWIVVRHPSTERVVQALRDIVTTLTITCAP